MKSSPLAGGWAGDDLYPRRTPSTSPVLGFPDEICGLGVRHARDLDRRHLEDVTRRTRLQPDALGGQDRLVHEDAGSLERKTRCSRGPHLVVARSRGELPVVDAATRRNEGDDRSPVSVEPIRTQLLPRWRPRAWQQLLESSLDACGSQERRNALYGLRPHGANRSQP